MAYPAATQPTLYFIGVTTGKSSIMRVFPSWARHFGLADAVIKGMDFPLDADPAGYREAVSFIKADPLSRGALVTTHKLDLFRACRDLFDAIDPHAARMHETSCLSKRGGRLICHAKDPISSALALDRFLPPGHFARTGAEVLAMGAGGSTIAHHLAPVAPARARRSAHRGSSSRTGPAAARRDPHAPRGSIGSRLPVDYVRRRRPRDE